MENTVPDPGAENPLLVRFVQAIVHGDTVKSAKLLETSPSLACQCLVAGATRRVATDFYFKEIEHYLVAGDTPLHAAAAGYRSTIAQQLLHKKAKVCARNRRGAEPLHYAADGGPGLRTWNPRAQVEMIILLTEAGADLNALDKSGVGPLHRAVRQRCSDAVEALLRCGADIRLKNKNGSTPLHLAVQDTGRGGSGQSESRACQRVIIQLLLKAGGDPEEQDWSGKTVRQCARSDWIREML
jgi:Ankyrin repeats (many copies)/Ankyrin repeat